MWMLMRTLLLMLLLSSCFTDCVPTPASASSYDALFVFGDSLLDPGNRHLLQPSAIGLPFPLIDADHLPYGRDFPTRMPTGRFSNGRIGSDILASLMGLPYPPPYLKDRSNVMQGCSFATSGAKIMNKTSARQFPRLNFIDQVSLFPGVRDQLVSRLGDVQASRMLSRSLFLTCLGSNDLMADYILNPVQRIRLSKEDFYQTLISAYTEFLQDLYDLGARKIAVVSLPPLGCIPALRAVLGTGLQKCAGDANEVVSGFNTALLQMTARLHVTHPDAHFVFLNCFDATLDALARPFHYGFLHGLQPCCGDNEERVVPVCVEGVNAICQRASEYIFWDFAHPTDAFNGVLARLYWEGSSPHVYPINLRELASL